MKIFMSLVLSIIFSEGKNVYALRNYIFPGTHSIIEFVVVQSVDVSFYNCNAMWTDILKLIRL